MKSIFLLFLPKRICCSVIKAVRDDWRVFQFDRLGSIRRGFLAMVLTGVAISYSGASSAEGFLPDSREILMMPQLCQWFYGPRVGMNPALIPKGPPFDASGCTRYHYYCDAHTDLVRAEKSAYTNPGRAKYLLGRAIATLKGQVQFRKAEPGCSKYLLADTSYTLGKALELYARLTKSSNYYAEAIGPLLEAIELTPEDVRPYQVLGDVYVALNKRQQAEDAIYKGLQVNPESRPLLRRYKEIGGKRPIPTRKPAAPVDAGSAGSTVKQEADKDPVRSQEAMPPSTSKGPASPEESQAAEPSVQLEKPSVEQDKPAPTRDCRFCVDLDNNPSNASPAPDQPGPAKQEADKPPCRFCP